MKQKFFLLVFVLLSFWAYGQSVDIFDVIPDPTSTQKSTISRAQKNIQRGDKMMDLARKGYEKYSKLFQSKKKGKRKKAEKKTVDAKKDLLSAANFYDNGYTDLYETYKDFFGTLQFETAEFESKANNLVAEAEKNYKNGHAILEKNKNYSDKELKKTVKFKQLQNSVSKGSSQEKSAVQMLAKAIKLYYSEKEEIKRRTEADNNAWADAVAQNTISAYQNYLNKFPNGLHAEEARQRIQEIEAEIEQQEALNKTSNLIYRVQILADKRPWTDSEIKAKIYNTSEPIYEVFYNGWYKYAIGEFHTYAEAKAFRDQIRKRRKGAFVIAFKDGEYIDDILQAINMENGQ